MINPWKPARRDPDLERIEQLYREYRLPLWRYAFKLLHDEHLADDVVQSVFIKAIEKSEIISSLDCNKSMAYFVIMVRNLSYTLYRQRNATRWSDLPTWRIFSPTPMRSRRRR